jgi:hypothetical protein
MTTSRLRDDIAALLAAQRLAVLATQDQNQPYTSLMAFAHTADLSTIVAATGQATRKHANIMAEARVSLLFDNRANSENDFTQAISLTAIGTATPHPVSSYPQYSALYLAKHPALRSFLESPSTVLLIITIERYLMVDNFEHIREMIVTP